MNRFYRMPIDKRLQFWIEELESEGTKVTEEEKESYLMDLIKWDHERKLAREKIKLILLDFFYSLLGKRKSHK